MTWPQSVVGSPWSSGLEPRSACCAGCGPPAGAPALPPAPSPHPVTSGGKATTLWGLCEGPGWGADAPGWHLLCCGRRWPSPGVSTCRPGGPSAASAGSAGNAGCAGTWPAHCPGFPRQPLAQRRSARRCLGRRTEGGGGEDEKVGRARCSRHRRWLPADTHTPSGRREIVTPVTRAPRDYSPATDEETEPERVCLPVATGPDGYR